MTKLILRGLAAGLALSSTQLVVAQVTPSAIPAVAEEGEPIIVGRIHEISSSVYGNRQTITVRLPKGYEQEPDRVWPTLYVVDGGPKQDFEMMAGLAAEAEYSGSFEPFIVIGVETKDRRSQLPPPETEKGRTKRLIGDYLTPNGAPTFRDYLAKDVMSWAEGRYRTGRKIVLGASLAGLFVLDTFLEKPEMFDDYIAITPSLWWDAGSVADKTPAKLAAHAASDRRLYLAMGDEGYQTQANLDRVVAALEAGAPEGLRWIYIDRSDSEEHRTMFLVSALDAMRTLYLLPERTGPANPFEFDGLKTPEYTPEARANLDKGKCRAEIAKRISFEEKNADPLRWWGHCLMMKPGPKPTAGNLESGRPGGTSGTTTP